MSDDTANTSPLSAGDLPTDSPPASTSGAVNFGDIMAKVQVRPTPAMLDQAANAGVPVSTETYDPIAIATYWAGLGYKVMPLKSMDEIRKGGFPEDQAGKIPSLKGKQEEQGTTDPEVIKRWWGDDSKRGVGIPTQANRLLVVDIDNDSHFRGEMSFMEMAADIGLDISNVPMSKSPSYHGGYHLYWRLPRTFGKMSLPAVSLIAKNVDLPWFVVAPGSWKRTTTGIDRHEKSVKGIGIQTWHAGDPADIPMAPAVLLDKLKRRGAIKGVPATEITRIERSNLRTGSDGKVDIKHYQQHGIPLGLKGLGQNGVLYKIACKMAGNSIGLAESEAVDECWDIIRNSPTKPNREPYTKEDVERLVRGAYVWVAADNEKKLQQRIRIISMLRSNSKKGLLK